MCISFFKRKPKPSKTPRPSITPTPTPSKTPIISPSITPSESKIVTPSITPSESKIVTPSITVSSTPSTSIIITPSVTPTITHSISLTPSPSVSISSTPTPSISITPTQSITPTISHTLPPSVTPSLTVSKSRIPVPSITPSVTPSLCLFPLDAVGYWKLDEISGNTLDSVGMHHGTLINSPTQGAVGKIRTCYNFSSANSQYITMGEVTDFKLPRLSVSAWFKTTTTGYLAIVSEVDGNLSAGWTLTTEWTKFRCEFGDNAGHTAVIDSTTTINTGAWFHIVFTFDGAIAKMYINGNQEGGNVSFPYNLSYQTGNNANFKIGSRGNVSQYMNGSIDEVGIWNRALTSSEVLILYNNGYGLEYCKKCLLNVAIDGIIY